MIWSCHKPQPTLYLVGDSTMANKTDLKFPERGWGQVLSTFFDSTIVIENHAKNGRSSRSFIYESRWDTVYSKLNPGDFVVIQFGHNDDVQTKVGRYTLPEEFAYNLSKFVKEALAKGAHPILCTPIIRRNYVDGVLESTHGVYPDKVREVAQKFNVPLVDMTKKSRELVLGLGEEASIELYMHLPPNTYEKAPGGRIDNTHFKEKGAIAMAKLFVEGVKEQHLELEKYLNH